MPSQAAASRLSVLPACARQPWMVLLVHERSHCASDVSLKLTETMFPLNKRKDTVNGGQKVRGAW